MDELANRLITEFLKPTIRRRSFIRGVTAMGVLTWLVGFPRSAHAKRVHMSGKLEKIPGPDWHPRVNITAGQDGISGRFLFLGGQEHGPHLCLISSGVAEAIPADHTEPHGAFYRETVGATRMDWEFGAHCRSMVIVEDDQTVAGDGKPHGSRSAWYRYDIDHLPFHCHMSEDLNTGVCALHTTFDMPSASPPGELIRTSILTGEGIRPVGDVWGGFVAHVAADGHMTQGGHLVEGSIWAQ